MDIDLRTCRWSTSHISCAVLKPSYFITSNCNREHLTQYLRAEGNTVMLWLVRKLTIPLPDVQQKWCQHKPPPFIQVTRIRVHITTSAKYQTTYIIRAIGIPNQILQPPPRKSSQQWYTTLNDQHTTAKSWLSNQAVSRLQWPGDRCLEVPLATQMQWSWHGTWWPYLQIACVIPNQRTPPTSSCSAPSLLPTVKSYCQTFPPTSDH